MPDNIIISTGSLGVTIASDQLAGGEHVQFFKLMDGTLDSSIKATVKSTQTSVSDGALVVALSQNGPLPSGSNHIGSVSQSGAPWTVQGMQSVRSGSIITSATHVAGPVVCNNYNVATVTLSGTFSGYSFAFEASDDGGTNWYAVQGCRTELSIIETGSVSVSSTNRAWDIPVGAFDRFRVRSIALGSGNPTIGISFQSMPFEPAPAVGIATITSIGVQRSTQSAIAMPTQNMKDSGRNQTNYFMATPIVTTNAEVTQSLTGFKNGAAVAATGTPAVVTANKTYRITTVVATYFNVATVGSARFNLRSNPTGSATVNSPLVASWQVGLSGDGTSTAGHTSTYTFNFPDGIEFFSGAGIAVGMVGFGAVPTSAAAVGYGMLSIIGFEY